MVDASAIQAFEERGFNAWPTRRSVLSGGWLFRLGDGYTNRANSVNAYLPNAPFDGVRELAEELFSQNGLAPLFRMTPLASTEADNALADAGYTVFSPTLLLTAPIVSKPVRRPELRQNQHLEPFGDSVKSGTDLRDVVLIARPTPEWIGGIAGMLGLTERDAAAHEAIVRAIVMPAAFATMRRAGSAVGYGLAVYERGAVGLFDLVVAERYRGQGLGRSLIDALMAWGQAIGARQAYLQVAEANVGALRLYDRLGFGRLYRYHYRLPPNRVAP
ncbi:GNAT family N-acetyltransferase [Amorphus sp. 3PC139-8]|uniref:GNAT family N-acetyltransferase n=1 Tax=Amorphus sp. 3PC139-8 TaxID=2735676 RepID=UPI00345DDB95